VLEAILDAWIQTQISNSCFLIRRERDDSEIKKFTQKHKWGRKFYDEDKPLIIVVVCVLTSTLRGAVADETFPVRFDSFAGTVVEDGLLLASFPPLQASLLSAGL
jgi:hypothetical protein